MRTSLQRRQKLLFVLRRCRREQLHRGVRVHSIPVRERQPTVERDLQPLHQRHRHDQHRFRVRRIDDDCSSGEPQRSRNLLTSEPTSSFCTWWDCTMIVADRDSIRRCFLPFFRWNGTMQWLTLSRDSVQWHRRLFYTIWRKTSFSCT